MTYKYCLNLLLSLICTTALAQKKPLDHSVYDDWKSIKTVQISLDAQYILYNITPQEGDARLLITDSEGKTLWDIPRGKDGVITDNSAYAVVTISAPYAEIRQARIKKKKPEEMPKDSLAVISLSTKELVKIANVKNYKLPLEASDYLAYLVQNPKQKKDSTNKVFSTLHLRNLRSGLDTAFFDVDDYEFDYAGNQLAFVRKAKKQKDSVDTQAGLYLFSIQNKLLKQISLGKGTYKNITFDQSGNQLAFTAEKNKEKALQKPYKLYYYTPESDTANILVSISNAGMPRNWNVSGNGELRFSKNGEKLFFGIAPIPKVKDTTLVDFETAKVDIWNWKDDYLQPQQLVNLEKELKRTYLSVIYPKKGTKIIPLASPELPNVKLSDDAENSYALGMTNYGRRIQSQWEGHSPEDFYLINTIDGSKRKIAENVYGRADISPTGKYVIWYDLEKQQWNCYNIAQNSLKILNLDLPVGFGDEDNDVPSFPSPYGVAGWTTNDEEVFIYDKYDIWSFDANGTDRQLLTNGAGRSQQISFRYEDLQPKTGMEKLHRSTIIETKKPFLVSAFNHINKEHGWFYINPKSKKDPKEVIMAPYSYRHINASRDLKYFLYTKENYQESPDLYLSKNFKNELKLSNINPQQTQYNWGTAELVKWTTPGGHAATGILYKPEDFDEHKQYPLIAYFYETLSDGLYSYIPPAPTPSRLNISYFVSNGYLVFAPDIKYQIGHPGKSAEEYVNSGMQELAKLPWVDGKHMGIQGQSWGGYQVAHLITRTNMYAAAWAGAPVVNMTSAYGGIRWQTGLNRQFQYEKTQSRIGTNLWDGYDLFIENSPLFHLRAVNTPVVIMANDGDGAVPWYQGIEMFTALRRLEKPVWLLNYNGEEHNLVKRQNRKDIQIREQQFFDHFLKGKPAPVWLAKGVPATLKGIDWGFDLVN